MMDVKQGTVSGLDPENLNEEQIAHIRLARSDSISPVTFRRLLKRFGSAKSVIEALPDLAVKSGKSVKLTSQSAVESEFKAAAKADAQYYLSGDPAYPPMLYHLGNPPPVLIGKGRAALLHKPAVAIVGARNSSAAARKLAHALAYDLAEQGIIIASGLARGIDTEAHRGTLAAAETNSSDDISTIGVIASGIDIAYPKQNAELQAQLARRALVVTEYGPGSDPIARHFPFRNRIIAGLSLATLVIEAAPRSGSLITARLANELGREVLAIPGSPLDGRSTGCNGLIREGATLVRDVNDILEAITPLLADSLTTDSEEKTGHVRFLEKDIASADPEPIAAACSDSDREHIRSQLSQTALAVDELAVLAERPIALVNAALVELEITGLCERVAGGKVKAAAG